MLWKECIQSDFYKFVCRQEHFICQGGKNVLYPKFLEIVWKFTDGDDKKL